MKSAIRTLYGTGMVLAAMVFAAPDASFAQGKGNKGGKAQQKVESKVTKQKDSYGTARGKAAGKKLSQRTRNARIASQRGPILCADGTWWSGTGAVCAGHDGVAARQGAYKGPTPRASARARERAAANSAVRRGTYSNTNPAGAIARCNDGTYWHSTTRTNACYGHGGVAVWL